MCDEVYLGQSCNGCLSSCRIINLAPALSLSAESRNQIHRKIDRIHRSEMDLSFIIPAYNEELELPATIEAIRKAAEDRSAEGRIRRGKHYEIIVVDDASSDET